MRARAVVAGLLALAAIFLTGGVAQAATYATVYNTGYSIYDNDPPGSREIAHPVIHQEASGTGTYYNPITVAVGLTKGKPNVPWGTRVYSAAFHKYGIVEDSCAACTGKWLDWWVDGSTSSASSADACMNKITGRHYLIFGAGRGWKVVRGVISHDNTCIRLYGETPVAA